MLEHLYEAAALIVNSQQGNLELGMMYLGMMGVLEEGRCVGGPLGSLDAMWDKERYTMKRAEHLKEVWPNIPFKALSPQRWYVRGASGAAVVGAALCGPSVPAPRGADARSPRDWRDF